MPKITESFYDKTKKLQAKLEKANNRITALMQLTNEKNGKIVRLEKQLSDAKKFTILYNQDEEKIVKLVNQLSDVIKFAEEK